MTPPSTKTARLRSLRSKLDSSLFPRVSDEGLGLGRGEAAIIVVALLVIAAILDLLRLGWSDSLNTVWAEDGPIYLQAALTEGFFHAIFAPYAGYLVVVPHLIAEVATLVPLRYAPAAISILSALLAALSGFAVWVAGAGHIRDRYLRGALALATVFAATAGQETLVSAAYAPWYMLIGSFWLLFWRPRTLAGALAGGLFLLATGISTPGVWFFLPVAALRALSVRDARDGVLLGGYGLGAVVQIPVVLGQEQGAPLWSSHIWTAYVQRVLDAGVFGQRLGGNLWEQWGWAFLITLCVAVVAGLVVGIVRSRPSARWFAALAIPISTVMFFVSVYQRTVGPSIFWSPGTSGGTASRYVMVPALLLLSAGVVLLDGALRRRSGRGSTLAVAGAVGVLMLAVVTSFDMSSPDHRGAPPWDDALRSAAVKCLAKHEEIAGIATAPAPFGVQIPCEQVSSFAPKRPASP